jgi:ABC-type transport system involved in cytochrome bd biosynthesis fused ATPase/permease subunit
MQRIEGYLSEPEVPDWATSLKHDERSPSKDEVAFVAATFEWHGVPTSTPSTRFQLGPLDLSFPTGKLTLVSGATGSGKTALLTALLGGRLDHFCIVVC